MSPPILPSPAPKVLIPQPLSQSSFSPYGAAITSPTEPTLNDAPSDISSLSRDPTAPVLANQGSAVKYSPISLMQNTYGTGKSKLQGSPRMSLFSCFPRSLRSNKTTSTSGSSSSSGLFDVRILERHPFTSQTFIPLSYGSTSGRSLGANGAPEVRADDAGEDEVLYLVIVAPSLVGQSATARVKSSDGGKSETILVHDPPDLRNMQSFLARPGQAVTYGAGTWHAPMVVLGRRRVDFLVVQFMNGISEEDCQEVEFGEGVAVEFRGDIREGGKSAKL